MAGAEGAGEGKERGGWGGGRADMIRDESEREGLKG